MCEFYCGFIINLKDCDTKTDAILGDINATSDLPVEKSFPHQNIGLSTMVSNSLNEQLRAVLIFKRRSTNAMYKKVNTHD